jgi:hypothetical protein
MRNLPTSGRTVAGLVIGLLLGIAAVVAIVAVARSGDGDAPVAQAQADAPSRDIDSYVLFAYESLVFKGRNTGDTGVISGGNVGVNNVDPDPNATELTFSGPVKMPVDGTQVVGNRARVDPGVPSYPTSIYELHANKVAASFDGSVLRSPCTSGCDPALRGAYPFDTPIIPLDELPELPSIDPGSEDVTVAAGASRSLAPGRYRDIRIQDGATLKLSAGLYEIGSLSGGVDATLATDPATEVRILRGVGFNASAFIGDPAQDHSKPQAADFARFYVKCEGINPVTACVSFGHNGQIHGQLLAPTGRLNLGGGNEYFGRFWAANIAGDPNNNLTFRRPASKSGLKFEDVNANGVRDEGEQGLEGWTIFVDYNDDGRLDGNEPSARTGADGRFSIHDEILPNDDSHPTWKVREVQQQGWTCSAPANGCVHEETFEAGEHRTGNDFGNWRPGSISGTKFKDANANGSRDSGETGLPGYTLYLDLNDNSQLDEGEPSTQSGADGSYAITGVKPGTYVLRETGGDSSLRCTYPIGCSFEISVESDTRVEGRDFGNAPSNGKTAAQGRQVLKFTFQRCAKAVLKPVFTGQVRGSAGRGSAKMNQPVGCLPRSYKVTVTGTNIETVVVKVDGRKYRTLHSPKLSFHLRSRDFSNGAHRLRANVYFTDSALTP